MERVREKRRVEERRVEERRAEERRSEGRKSQKKEDADVRKGRKIAQHCVFSVICGSGGSKSRPAKAAGAEPSGKMKNCTPLWCEAHLQVKKLKTPHVRTAFGSCDVEKVHAIVKCTKHTRFGPLLKVEMSKKCTPLWRKAPFEVKMYTKHTSFGPLLDVQSSFRMAGARDCAPCRR